MDDAIEPVGGLGFSHTGLAGEATSDLRFLHTRFNLAGSPRQNAAGRRVGFREIVGLKAVGDRKNSLNS